MKLFAPVATYDVVIALLVPATSGVALLGSGSTPTLTTLYDLAAVALMIAPLVPWPAPRSTTPLVLIKIGLSTLYAPALRKTAPLNPFESSGSPETKSIALWMFWVLSSETGLIVLLTSTNGIATPPPLYPQNEMSGIVLTELLSP